MSRVVVLFALMAFTLWAFLDVLQTPPRQVAVLPKALWLVVVLVPLVGPAAWLLGGRTTTPVGGATTPARQRPMGPDDDPDFLRGL